jgi:hypothetical protein
MRKINGKFVSAVLAAALAAALCVPALAADAATLDKAVSDAAAYMLRSVKAPEVGSIGGEWAVIGLARSGYDVPDSYFENYYRTVEQYVEDCGGVLHEKKYTEYSRVILGLTAAGYDPRDVAGYDLTAPLGDFERTIWQGINGPIWALIALDSMNYPIPENPAAKTQATRDRYIAEILRRQTPDGGWDLDDRKGDPDMTGMALQALARYQHKPDVKAATDRAIALMSEIQDDTGGYRGWNSVNSESAVQVLVALCALGISQDDARFVKNGHTLVDNILTFKNADGSFKHTEDNQGESQMSSEQAFYGLIAAQRARDGKNSLYDMTDAVQRENFAPIDPDPDAGYAEGLPDRNENVSAAPVTVPGKTFEDTLGHANAAAIEALASREIINGKSDDRFDPDATVTRAEFAAVVTRGLGLQPVGPGGGYPFGDVQSGKWYFNYVYTAYYYEIVSGVGGGAFNPEGRITREQAAVMTVRAAKLAGLDTDLANVEILDTLAPFGDYRTVSDYAREQLAFCYMNGIMDDTEFDIEPKEEVTRAEIAEMLYRMLDRARLI